MTLVRLNVIGHGWGGTFNYPASTHWLVNSALVHIDPHIKFTIELPVTHALPILDTVTKPTPNSIESTVYRKPTNTDRYLDYSS